MSRPNTGFGKDSLAPYQGDQGLDMLDSAGQPVVRFQSTALNYPNNSGWDVQTSSQVSPDGRSFQTETVAKTDGMEKIQGGIAEFKGHNNQRSMASHEGDDKNFVKKASEFSNSNLHEKVVIGDENSGMTEVKMTSTSSTSSSNVFSSSSTTVCDGEPTSDLIRNQNLHHNQNRDQLFKDHQQEQLQHTQNRERLFKEHQQEQLQHMQNREQLFKEHQQERRESQTVEERQRLEEINRHTQRDSSVSNAKVEELNEQSKRLINVDKASPEYQRHVQELMSQPGEIISNTVEYPKPNVKMITTVKRLPDGTIVKNKRYETEEVSQDKAHSERFQKVSDKKTTYRNQNQNVNEQTRTNVTENPRGSPNSPYRNVNRNVELVDDDVSNVERVEKSSFSQVKKTSQHSSTVDSREERNNTWDQKEVTKKNSQDFSTHGFPSVKSNIRTQEYPSGRPQTEQLNAVSPDKSHPIMRATPTRDGGEAVVSEKSVTIKKKVTAERYVETEVASDAGASTYNDVQNFQQINENQTFYSPDSVVNSPHQPQHPNLPHQSHPRQPHQNVPHQQHHHQNDIKIVRDFNTNTSQTVPRNSQPQGVSVTSQNVQTSKQYNDSQRITEREINEHGKFTQNREHFIDTHKVDRPSNQKPDFSTHGFPSVPGTNRTHDISPVPTSVAPSKVTQRKPDQVDKPRSSPVKEKELDATHRRFAASLRCSSPLDYTDSHRSSPSRTSVSSTRTFKREGSHDSASPSDTSRISSTTVTRQTPRKSPAKEVHDAATRTHTTSTVTRTPKTVTKTTTTTIRTKLPHEAAKTDNQITAISARKPQKPSHYAFNNVQSTRVLQAPVLQRHVKLNTLEKNKKNARPSQLSLPKGKPLRKKVAPVMEHIAPIEVEEPLCVKKNYYKLGPNTTTKVANKP